jgi:hypothetical protein
LFGRGGICYFGIAALTIATGLRQIAAGYLVNIAV